MTTLLENLRIDALTLPPMTDDRFEELIALSLYGLPYVQDAYGSPGGANTAAKDLADAMMEVARLKALIDTLTDTAG